MDIGCYCPVCTWRHTIIIIELIIEFNHSIPSTPNGQLVSSANTPYIRRP